MLIKKRLIKPISSRQFSKVQKLEKYALMEHKEKGLLQREKLLTTGSTFRKDPTEINSPHYNPMAKPLPLFMHTKQHPTNLDGKDTYMISYKRPPRPLSPRYTIPPEALEPTPVPFESPTGSRLVEAIFVGPPNAGKSSLVNRIINTHLSAVSDKRGTTEELKTFYFTRGLTQVVIKDTPGATKASSYVNSNLMITK